VGESPTSHVVLWVCFWADGDSVLVYIVEEHKINKALEEYSQIGLSGKRMDEGESRSGEKLSRVSFTFSLSLSSFAAC
jgi:hypothetical protein